MNEEQTPYQKKIAEALAVADKTLAGSAELGRASADSARANVDDYIQKITIRQRLLNTATPAETADAIFACRAQSASEKADPWVIHYLDAFTGKFAELEPRFTGEWTKASAAIRTASPRTSPQSSAQPGRS